MLKRFFCGAVLVAALCGTGTAPVRADELYIRNHPYKDVYFSGGTSYVTVDGFLNAVKMPWRLNGNTVVLGKGDSPDLTATGSSLMVTNGEDTVELSGIVRDGKLYVPTKAIAEAAGYGVIYNASTGVTDVVKSRLVNADDAKIASDIEAGHKADKDKRDAAWQARVDKAREARKAKAEAAKAKDDEEVATSDDEEKGDADSKDLKAKGDSEKDPSDTKEEKLNGKEKGDLQSYEAEKAPSDKDASVTAEDTKVAKADEKKAPPPKADLVVLSADADPNNYTGDVVIKAVLQNQGYADATGVQARLIVIGPDGKQWVNKNMYHADIKPDGRWEIVENYHHRAASAIPRGDYNVKVVPTFQSAAPKE